MRILVVSAHYPPDFVSGGTLQPQRVARGLHTRGHEVSVFAGHLDHAQQPLTEWDEVGDDHVPIHWITTWPYTEWRERRNWDNPAVARAFAARLTIQPPDVVHVHSLQGLGIGVLAAAKNAGLPVIVTMHDFWWMCARQFLCDRRYEPCSLVIDTSTCACEVSPRWRDKRMQRLFDALADADVVLAPSASAARVLAANGVDPKILRVDENGLDDDVLGTTPEPLDPPENRRTAVRFLYTGGSDRMKGVQHLVDAATVLRDLDGWNLSAYGIERYLAESGRSVDGLPIEISAPYDPLEAPNIFAAHDVLVVPSVARETYSLVTREALRHGLAVLCTDTLGPEEVVRDGINGMIVPAGDSDALASAMSRLVHDPDLVTPMRREAPSVTIRSVADQLDGLESLYADIARHAVRPVTHRSQPRRRHRARDGVLFVTGIEGAPFRYRVRLPAEALRGVGVTSKVVHYRDPRLARLASKAQWVVLYRVPATPDVLTLLGELGAAGVPRYFDVDDLIVDTAIASEVPAVQLLPPDEAALWVEGVQRYRTTLEGCDALITSTAPLARHIANLTGHGTHVFENGVGSVLAKRADAELHRPRLPGPLRIGYFSGTKTHDLDWAAVEPAVARVLAHNPDVELWLGGHLNASDALAPFASRTRRLPLLPWLELPGVLRDIDINLAPLTPGVFNEAKSAIKWLEAALVETPTVATPTEPFVAAIDAGVTGFLAQDDDEWIDAIERLLTDAHLRQRMGSLARREALLRWPPRLQGRRYKDILESALEPRPSTVRRAPVVTATEPSSPVQLEPYSLNGSIRGQAFERVRRDAWSARQLIATAAGGMRNDGVAATGKRILRWSARNARARLRRGV